jgi:hypothetical protein
MKELSVPMGHKESVEASKEFEDTWRFVTPCDYRNTEDLAEADRFVFEFKDLMLEYLATLEGANLISEMRRLDKISTGMYHYKSVNKANGKKK